MENQFQSDLFSCHVQRSLVSSLRKIDILAAAPWQETERKKDEKRENEREIVRKAQGKDRMAS